MRQRDLIVNPTLACGNPLNFKEDLDILEKTGIKMVRKGLYTVMVKWVAPILLFLLLLKSLGILTII